MVSLLDCTLRDGGWVNQFDFGKQNMCHIVSSIASSHVEYIELGYLDKVNGWDLARSMYTDMSSMSNNYSFPSTEKDSTKKTVMIDYGKFPVEDIVEQKDSILDGIRVCFHKKNLKEAVAFGKQILKKGYLLFMQPMAVNRYTEEEFGELIQYIQQELPKVHAIYIVDSFGCMKPEDLCKRLTSIDQYLDENINIGIHLHNNQNLAYKNAVAAFQWVVRSGIAAKREIIFDSSLMGLGKGSGNLILEDYADYLNNECGKQYDVADLRELAKTVIEPIGQTYTWGYDPIYELSALYEVTPSYAKILCEDQGLSLKQLEDFLKQIPEEKKDSCDRAYVVKYVERLKQAGDRE